jgi:hypothetical protein
LYLNNQRSYGKMEGTGRFTASNWSKISPPRCSDCRLVMLYKVVKKLWPEVFAFRLWRCSGQPCNNQQRDRQMDVTVGFSRSERSRNNLGRHSNCSGRMFYGREKWISDWASLEVKLEPRVSTECWLLVWFLSLCGYCWVERT